MVEVKKKDLRDKNIDVYDISLDGTFVNALGGNVLHNTDGFNFQLPNSFRYTEEHPYISDGRGRNYPKGKSYVGCQADVAEFENEYLSTAYGEGVQKMGLDIDEIIPASINISRKNYIDVLDDGSIKLVGNTIKSRRLSSFIEKFFDEAIPVLAHGHGWDFLNMYYDYLAKIYNYQIPLKDIASKGKIKKTLKEYQIDCETRTKSGSKKSRQAWYELALMHNLTVDLNDTVYYVNTGKGKNSDSDVKRISHRYTVLDGEEVEIKSKKIENQIVMNWCKKKKKDYTEITKAESKKIIDESVTRENDEIILNCKMIPMSIIDSEEDLLCCDVGEDFEYNASKYIDMFNKRVQVLFVCFHPNIRSRILVTNPSQRPQFTEEECALVSGYPNKPSDQDTYEQLMTPERREIEFWLSINQTPPFVKECGIDWDKMVEEYKEIKKQEDNELFKEENEKYLKALSELTKEDFEAFQEDDKIPSSLTAIVHLETDLHFYFNKLPNMTPSTGGFVLDDLMFDDTSVMFQDKSEEIFEEAVYNSYQQ